MRVVFPSTEAVLTRLDALPERRATSLGTLATAAIDRTIDRRESAKSRTKALRPVALVVRKAEAALLLAGANAAQGFCNELAAAIDARLAAMGSRESADVRLVPGRTTRVRVSIAKHLPKSISDIATGALKIPVEPEPDDEVPAIAAKKTAPVAKRGYRDLDTIYDELSREHEATVRTCMFLVSAHMTAKRFEIVFGQDRDTVLGFSLGRLAVPVEQAYILAAAVVGAVHGPDIPKDAERPSIEQTRAVADALLGRIQ